MSRCSNGCGRLFPPLPHRHGDLVRPSRVARRSRGPVWRQSQRHSDRVPDPHAALGRFGPEAERLAVLPREQVEALWQAAAVVPQACSTPTLGRRRRAKCSTRDPREQYARLPSPPKPRRGRQTC